MTDERAKINEYIEKLLEGDRTVVASLSHIISQYFIRFGGYRCDDPENLKGEVLSALVHNLRRGVFKGENIRQLNAYLRSIVLNIVLRDQEGQKRTEPLEDTDSVADLAKDGSEVLSDKDLAAFVLDRLQAPCRDLLTMKFLQDLDNAEIAEKLNLREVTVRVRVFRCTECAKQILRAYGLL